MSTPRGAMMGPGSYTLSGGGLKGTSLHLDETIYSGDV